MLHLALSCSRPFGITEPSISGSGREAVLSHLRKRQTDRAGRHKIEIIDAGDDVFVVLRTRAVKDGPRSGAGPAPVVRLRNGKVISMRQFRSREEALASAG